MKWIAVATVFLLLLVLVASVAVTTATVAIQNVTVSSPIPNPPLNLRATLNEDGAITLTWTPPDSPDVASYSIYISSTASNFNFSFPNATVAHPTSAWTDMDAILTPERYYIVRAKNSEEKEEKNNNTVGKFTIPLYSIDNWNLVSTPLEPHDTSPISLFSPIANNCSIIWTYNASETEPWKKYIPSAPSFADTLHKVDHKMGFWMKMTKNDTLTVTGSVPVSTSINVKTGWNIIGYPSTTTKPVDEALFLIYGNYGMVWAYDASDAEDHWKLFDPFMPPPPPSSPSLNDLQDMAPGSGYWIYMTSECTLEI